MKLAPTHSTKPIKASEISREWHLVDAKEKPLGRLATEIASWLMGKHKRNFAPYLDMGDHVVVTNVSAVQVTGKKANTKVYANYSGYPGGLKRTTFEKMKELKPEYIVRHAVYGMLPKNKLRDKRIIRLHLFKGDVHSFADKFNK